MYISKQAQQPMREEALLTGELESTNELYAIAKIAGIWSRSDDSRISRNNKTSHRI